MQSLLICTTISSQATAIRCYKYSCSMADNLDINKSCNLHLQCTYLAPLKSEMRDRNEVIQRDIRAGTTSGGINTEDAEAMLNIILGINVCKK